MPMPMPVHAKFEIALWLGETKLRLKGEVASASPGFGMGVRFTNLSPENRELLRRHMQSIHEIATSISARQSSCMLELATTPPSD